MNESTYYAVSIECIIPDVFPMVPLYMKHNENFVLYKGHEQQFTSADRVRLEKNRTDFLFVRQGDMESVTPLLEGGIADILGADTLSGRAKGKFLYQTAINFLNEMYDNQEKLADASRCINIAESLVNFVLTDKNAANLLQTVIAHNYFLFVHSVQVTVLSLLMHKAEGVQERDLLVEVATGCLLHDIGMSFIPRPIIDKPHSLKDLEYLKIKKHPVLGHGHLQPIGAYASTVLDIVRLHHERYDGSGYPMLLKKDEIPHSVQIVSLCDVYSALTTDRPYQKTASRKEALRMMKEDLRIGFHPKLLKSFEEMIMRVMEAN